MNAVPQRRSFMVEYQSGVAEAEAGMRRKSIIGLGDGLSDWSGASRQDGTNFRTNMVTLANYEDAAAGGNTLGLSAVWACVNLLAGTIASLPLMVYRTDGEIRRVAKDHPLYRMLHDSPNADQTAVDFWEFMQASLELHGNAYAEKQLIGARMVGLSPVRPDIVQVSRVSGGLEYRWADNGRQIVRRDVDMLHIRGFGGNPLGGASTLSVCGGTFGAARSVQSASTSMFRNGVRPSGVLSMPTPLKAEQRQEAERLLQEKFVGAMNEGRPMLLDNGLTWTQLSIKPADAEMLESRKFSGEEICRIFGVPPAMVGYGDKASNWGTGKEVDVLGFQKFTLRRRLKRIEQSLEKQLLSPADRAAGVIIEFNLEGLLRGDSVARAGFYKAGLNDGWLNVNQVCKWENLPPVEGGDVNRVQMQNVPLTSEPDTGGNDGGSALAPPPA